MSGGISTAKADFEFRTGKGVFSPYDLVELPRPGAGVANPAGDVVFVPVSKYSIKDKECVLYYTAPHPYYYTSPSPLQMIR